MSDINLALPSTADDAAVLAPKAAVKKRNTLFWRLMRSKAAVFGAVLVILLVVAALLAPVVAPYDPIQQSFMQQLQPPSAEHLLGTDEFGRDIFSRILHGSRWALFVGLLADTIALFLGVVLGVIGGFYGGKVDAVIGWLTDVMMAFPYLLLAMIVVAVLGPGITNAMIAIGIVYVPKYIRIVRGTVLSLKEKEFVEAARSIGLSSPRIMFRHILPNCIAPIIVVATLAIGWAIVETAGLSFLGLGAQPPTPEWGAMLASGRNYMLSAWWIATFPGLAILFVVVGFNLLGDGLRDVLDPYMRGRS